MALRNDKLLWGLYCLRFGLALFIILLGVDKFVDPSTTLAIFRSFNLVSTHWWIALLIGAAEIVLGVFILLGVYKRFSYAMGLLVHVAATLARYGLLAASLGKYHTIIAALPILFAFITLFLCRDFDTKLTLQRKRSIFFQRN